MRGIRRWTPLAVCVLSLLVPATARATQQFAKETVLSCDMCHTATMKLTPFGAGFRNSNLRLMHVAKNGAPVVALRGQLAYTSEPDPTGLPKAIVDEIDSFVAGQIGDHVTYFTEVYNVDGGRTGSAREAWLQYVSNHQRRSSAVRLRVGLLSLPMPVDPEAFRETNNHYAIWDQSVGSNPFTLFDPHSGVMVAFGSPVKGTSVSVLALQSHDPQSALSPNGIDTMFALTHIAGPIVANAYRYDGHRPIGTIRDTFQRTGYGAGWYSGRVQLLGVVQSGFDSSFDGQGARAASGGGFLQARYALNARTFAIARYDGTEDTTGSFARSLTVGYGVRLGSAFRAELEDVLQHTPATKHTLNVVFGFGFSNTGGSQTY